MIPALVRDGAPRRVDDPVAPLRMRLRDGWLDDEEPTSASSRPSVREGSRQVAAQATAPRGRPRNRVSGEEARASDGAVSWTGGHAFAARAMTLVLWLAVAAGPAALVLGLAKPAPAETPVTAGPAASQHEVAAFAVGAVGAWLSSTSDDPSRIRAYLPDARVDTPAPTPYRDPVVASVVDTAGVSAVVVGVMIESPSRDGGAAAGATWVRVHFQVAVSTATGLGLLGMPAFVAAPGAGDVTAVAGPAQPLTVTSEAGTAVVLFLAAYLTGSSDALRFTSPNAAVSLPAATPYVAAQATALSVDVAPPDDPANGQSLRVRAAFSATDPRGGVHALEYWLTLTARDGRWEVASIDPGPLGNDAGVALTPAATPTPTF